MSDPTSKTTAKSLKDLQLTEANPRKLDQAASETMDRSLDEFGSLDGIVYNVQLGELVGGNQRTIKFRKDPSAVTTILHTYPRPTNAGTVAVGFVETGGERWPYREVKWSSAKHRKAVYAANKVHADWDTTLALAELGLMNAEDLMDTGFSTAELEAWNVKEETAELAEKDSTEPTDRRFSKQELTDMAAIHFNNGGPNDVNQFISGLPGA